MTKQAIGFSNYYYTLWSIKTEPQYIVDNYGSRFLVGYSHYYYYQKNISMDRDKAFGAYPELEFDEDLKGIHGLHWHKENKEDLCPNIMKFGKYFKHNIDELVISDFDYIIWVCNNMHQTPNGKYALSLSPVIEYYTKIAEIENNLIQKQENVFQELISNGIFEFTPENNLRVLDDFAYMTTVVDDISITFHFPSSSYKKMTYGGYDYGLPLFNGKAKRIKAKRIKLSFDENTNYEHTVNVNHIELI